MDPSYLQVCEVCYRGDLEALQRWFPDDPTQWRSPEGDSLLHVAAQSPHLPVFNWLRTFPLDVNEPTAYGRTPLMCACLYGQKAMAQWLLDQGARVQATDLKKRTALHMACVGLWVDGVALLLEYGADPEAQDHQGRLPEHSLFASISCDVAIRTLLDAARQGCGLK
jgi:ankyrin repeat protein